VFRNRIVSAFAACAVAVVLGGASASAATVVTFTAANGATGEADFTFGTNTLSLVLKDTSVNPSDVSFNLSGFEFTLSGGTGATLTNETSPESRTVALGGTYTDAGPVSGFANVGWVYTASTGTEFKLDVLTGTGHAGPANTILGLPAADNKYDAAGGSIAGSPSHNPFLANSITYTFTFTGGVTSATTVTESQYQFGTTDGNFVTTGGGGGGGGSVTPEPASLLLSLSGMGLLGIGAMRRKLARGKA